MIVGGVCASCDRLPGGSPPRLAAWLRVHRIGLFTVLVFLVGGAVGTLVAHETTSQGPSPAAITAVTGPDHGVGTSVPAPSLTGSVFAINTTVGDALTGVTGTRGYGFVARSGRGYSDVITDYHLLTGIYLGGGRVVQLDQGDRTYQGHIVAVSTEPHVAVIRIRGNWPEAPIAATLPRPGDTVALPGFGLQETWHATVTIYPGPGGAAHLVLTAAIADDYSGAPVLDDAGRVVGIAEASSQFPHARGLGFAVPITVACAAAQTC